MECAVRARKAVSRYHQWLVNCRKLWRKITSGCKMCTNQDAHLHQQIVGAQNAAFTVMANSCNGFDQLIERVWISNAHTLNEAATKKVEQHVARFKWVSQAPPTLYDHFLSQVRRAPEWSSTAEALEAGFQNHCVFMRYFHELGEFESRFHQCVTDLSKTVTDMNQFLDRSSTQVNQFFVKRFGKSITGEAQSKLSGDEAGEISAALTVAIANLKVFQQPALPQFVIPQSPLFPTDLGAPLRLIVKTHHDGTNPEELAVALDDQVELVRADSVSYWYGKASDRREGLVPVASLKPPAVQGQRRSPTDLASPASVRD
jgi:hypothetical protein